MVTVKPNFHKLEAVIKGNEDPERVHFAELQFDPEPISALMQRLFGEEIPSYFELVEEKIDSFKQNGEVVLLDSEKEKDYVKKFIRLSRELGYDYVPDVYPAFTLYAMIMPVTRVSKDTASLSRGKRDWVEEGIGVISSWKDFESFHWEDIELKNLEGYYSYLSDRLPQGMGVPAYGSLFEQVSEKILGYEVLFKGLYNNRGLIKAVFEQWGDILLNYYSKVLSLEPVSFLFHGDDLGYKSGLMISPNDLKELVFPYFKRFVTLAHEKDMMVWHHCCGRYYEVIDYLINEVGIDAFHSFQDMILPIVEFMERYGDRVGALGGIDMDKIARSEKGEIKDYVIEILDEAMDLGRFALGTGNSVANYVPIDNYLAMLEAGENW